MQDLFGRSANWIDESGLNFAFQCGTLLVCYLGLRRWLARSIPFIATSASAGLIFALPKTIVYDSMAQFIGATCLLILSKVTYEWHGKRKPHASLFLALGTALATLTLTKQSTALGYAFTILLVLAIAPSGLRTKAKLWNITLLLLGGLGGIAVLCGLMSRSMSTSGMIIDVFRRGSAPKGGGSAILGHLLHYNYAPILVVALGFAVLWGKSALFNKSRPLGLHSEPSITGLLIAASGLAAWYVMPFPNRHILQILTAIIFGIALAFAVRWLALRRTDVEGAFGLLCFVALGGALTHNLSVAELRLAYDNNPIISYAVAGLLAVIMSIGWSRPLPRIATYAVCALVVIACWGNMKWQLASVSESTDRWPEVPYLEGARFRPQASGMRSLTALVKSQSRPEERVLLLPEDPDVEAWFDRSRPLLSSAIIFTDQYWPTDVANDFARLQKDPPRLIVIGPRNYWRAFGQQWTGADAMLIDRVQGELLPARYVRVEEHAILHSGKEDFMDVYRLK
jgi:hypothetical protein